MSAAEVIDEIKRLPPEEQEKVFAFVEATRTGEVRSNPEVGYVGRDEARAIRQRIFETNAELLRKLAQ